MVTGLGACQKACLEPPVPPPNGRVESCEPPIPNGGVCKLDCFVYDVFGANVAAKTENFVCTNAEWNEPLCSLFRVESGNCERRGACLTNAGWPYAAQAGTCVTLARPT